MSLLQHIEGLKAQGRKAFALLIDPDKIQPLRLPARLETAQAQGVDFIFVGGSLTAAPNVSEQIIEIKKHCNLPVFLFPGSMLQLSSQADALLFLSLISGRNPEYLIGHHVIAAPSLQKMNIEVLPTGYILVDAGRQTSVSYMSGSQPIPYDKPDIARYTALAGQYLGLRLIYMDAGSGAEKPISAAMIQAVAALLSVPLIVGGGLRTPQQLQTALNAGADIVVVGNSIENDPDNARLIEMAATVKNWRP